VIRLRKRCKIEDDNVREEVRGSGEDDQEEVSDGQDGVRPEPEQKNPLDPNHPYYPAHL